MLCYRCRGLDFDGVARWKKSKAAAAFMPAILRSGCWALYIVSKFKREAGAQSHWDVVYIAEAIGRALEEHVISATLAPLALSPNHFFAQRIS